MSGAGYRLLGHLVWRAGKWYMRRRLARIGRTGQAALVGVGLLACAAAAAAGVAIVRRGGG